MGVKLYRPSIIISLNLKVRKRERKRPLVTETSMKGLGPGNNIVLLSNKIVQNKFLEIWKNNDMNLSIDVNDEDIYLK